MRYLRKQEKLVNTIKKFKFNNYQIQLLSVHKIVENHLSFMCEVMEGD